MNRLPNVRLLLAGAAFVTLAGPALALDGQDVLDKINAANAPDGGVLKAASIDVSGDDVALKGVTFDVRASDSEPLKIGDVTLEGVSESDDGGYYIERVTLPEVDVTEDKTKVSVKDLYLSGVHVPGETSSDSLYSLMQYEEAHSGPATVTVDGKTVFSMEEASATTEIADDEQSMTFEATITGIKADLGSVEDAKTKNAIEKLGLTQISGQLVTSGSWDLSDGTISVDEWAFDFADIGRLDVSFSVSGYTMQLVRQLQETARTMQAQPDNEQVQQAAGLTMLGLMQQMSFAGAAIVFEDAGITRRGLDFAGEQQGTSGDQMAQMVKAMVPMFLAQAKLGELQNQITAAVNAFIDNPQNLTVTAVPENPVPFPMIMGAAMGTPETLPDLLGVAVSAND